jgi:hypothetical protein
MMKALFQLTACGLLITTSVSIAVGQEPTAETTPASSSASSLLAGLDALPPDIKPGECYVRVRHPAKYETTQERVLVKPEAIRYEIMPAEFKEVEKEILIKPETVSYEIVPAQFETKEVEVVMAPDYTHLSASEPEFQSEQATVVTRAARLALKLGEDVFNRSEQMTSEVLCLINEDAESQEYSRHLLIKPAQIKQEKIAKAVEKITTQVLVKPAEVKEVKVPAEVKKVMVKELVRPATKKEVKIPAEYTMITRHRLVEPERIAWQRVLCSTNMNADVVKSIQTKLKEKGVDCGEVNGELNEATKAAILQYQTQNNIAQGGLTYEFLEHIGMKLGQ